MTIEHVQPSEWAVIGARLERCFAVSLYRYKNGWACGLCLNDTRSSDVEGHKTPLEALTAALDAAERTK